MSKKENLKKQTRNLNKAAKMASQNKVEKEDSAEEKNKKIRPQFTTITAVLKVPVIYTREDEHGRYKIEFDTPNEFVGERVESKEMIEDVIKKLKTVGLEIVSLGF